MADIGTTTMSYPVTSLLSPKSDYILLYETTPKGQIAFSRYDLAGPKGKHALWNEEQQTTITGAVSMPGQISAVYLYGLPTVFGAAKLAKAPPKGDGADDDTEGGTNTADTTEKRVVAQISPVMQTIDSIVDKLAEFTVPPTNPTVAAATDDSNRTWLYYWTKLNGTLALKCATVQLNQDDDEEVFYNEFTGCAGTSESKIAVAPIPPAKPEGAVDRLVFFQEKGDGNNTYINVVRMTGRTGSSESQVPQTNNARAGAPLAAVISPKNRKVALYYLTANDNLYMTSASVDDLGTWTTPAPLDGANDQGKEPNSESSLSAVMAPKGAYVFYIAKGKKKRYTCAIDRKILG